MKTDAAETYDKLIKIQHEEHGWFVEARLEAVVSDETYQWILECLLHATNGLTPRVLFTDADADIQIQLQLDKEEKFERLEEQVNQNPTVGLPNVIERYFKHIDGIIKKYLTPQVLKIQRHQMNKSLLYRVKKIENWEHLLEHENWETTLKALDTPQFFLPDGKELKWFKKAQSKPKAKNTPNMKRSGKSDKILDSNQPKKKDNTKSSKKVSKNNNQVKNNPNTQKKAKNSSKKKGGNKDNKEVLAKILALLQELV
ncbi:hypothetical protein RhiirA4_430790 [Rhizophagus irregularis]|uniref:Uncharacterized protein n=1 Tax=Rhizophagus irregularis TaxID=588596 RepID=A0A2I1HM69_9GLOM|nr:hypothetical protein RhiirA4_430790 [Rhizophagus irregularis]